MRAVIVGDEIRGAKTLHALLHECCNNVEVCAMAHSVEEAEAVIRQEMPEVVFLDIEMPDGNGFELLEKLSGQDFQVVFTTAYDHFAIRAFKTNAISYLLKPIDADELCAAVAKLDAHFAQSQQGRISNIETVLNELRAQMKVKTKLAIQSVEGISFVPLESIIRLEADSNYTHIFLVGGKKITSAKTLKDYEATLTMSNFFRVHNTHLINLQHIERYIKGEGGYVVTSDKVTIEVSRRRKAELLDLLSKFG